MHGTEPKKKSYVDQIRQRYGEGQDAVSEKAVSLAVLNGSLTVGFLVLGAIRLIGGSIVIGLAEVVISDENLDISANLEQVGEDNVRSFAELQKTLSSLS